MLAELKKQQFRFKKSYGQNFIFDDNILQDVVDKITITKEDLVLEVGAGTGNLTKYIVPKASKTIAYEVDDKLIGLLEKNLATAVGQYEIKAQDFLSTNLALLDQEKKLFQNIILIANLPYVITSPVLFKVLHEGNAIDKMLLMVQKEVGERILASPQTKKYNALSVLLQYFFTIKLEKAVGKEVFYPAPEVDSVVLSFVRRRTKTVADDKFINFVKICFRQKRKTLKNNLKSLPQIDLSAMERILEEEGFSLQTRAEALPVEVFEKLVKKVQNETI